MKHENNIKMHKNRHDENKIYYAIMYKMYQINVHNENESSKRGW